ncbi:MFS transporter [Mycobacterium sp.]|uniref:MFS transporter n=1 Tax=Mycobacterium sp. TaxID=1785 RepID=UPI0031D3A0A6
MPLVIASMIALNTALGEIAIATKASQGQLTWMVDGYTLAVACLLMPAGAIGDRYGRRGALLFGLAVFAIACVGPVVLAHPAQIIAWRVLAGVGGAFVMPATLSMLTVAYPPEQRLRAIGVWAAVAGSGAIIGMLGSGVLLRYWSWQSIFWALGAAAAIVFVLTCTLTSSRDPDAPPLDWLGALLIGFALIASVFGLLEAPSQGWSHPLVTGFLAVGFALAVVFGVVELKQPHPLLDVRLFKNREFSTGVATIAVLFGATFGFFYLGVQYMQLIKGYSALHTAIAFSPFVVPLAGLSAMSFWYLPRLGLRTVVILGLAIMAVGFLGMGGLNQHSSYADITWHAVVLSTGIGFCTAPTTAVIMKAVPDGKQGVASAVNDSAREVGAALGIAVAGSVLARSYGTALEPKLHGFPEIVKGPALNSLATALHTADSLGPRSMGLAELSTSAFITAMHTAALAMAVVSAVAAVLIGLLAPGRETKTQVPAQLS